MVIEESWGQKWIYSQRCILEFTCNSAYFLAIVQVTKSMSPMITIAIPHCLQVQWADVIISKTRALSIFQQGITNWVLNFGLVFKTACAAFLLNFLYSYFIGFYPIAPEWWIPALPLSLLIWVSKNFSQNFELITMIAGGQRDQARSPRGDLAWRLPHHGDLQVVCQRLCVR